MFPAFSPLFLFPIRSLFFMTLFLLPSPLSLLLLKELLGMALLLSHMDRHNQATPPNVILCGSRLRPAKPPADCPVSPANTTARARTNSHVPTCHTHMQTPVHATQHTHTRVHTGYITQSCRHHTHVHMHTHHTHACTCMHQTYMCTHTPHTHVHTRTHTTFCHSQA